MVNSGGVESTPLPSNGSAPATTTPTSAVVVRNSPSPPAAMSGLSQQSPSGSPSSGTGSSATALNGVRGGSCSSGTSGTTPTKSMITGNADDYQNYTMSRIITEALERSNVGCTPSSASPPPPNKVETSSTTNNNNGTAAASLPSSTNASEEESTGGGQKRSNEEMESSTATKPNLESGSDVEDASRINSEQQASKRMKVET